MIDRCRLAVVFIPMLLLVPACLPEVAEDRGEVDAGSDGEGTGEGEDIEDQTQQDGPGVLGDVCSFNNDCHLELRCSCDGDCACVEGARGTGRNGVDACEVGEDCATALCVEANDGFVCSGPCSVDADCGPGLPLCADIAFVGRICVRDPNG